MSLATFADRVLAQVPRQGTVVIVADDPADLARRPVLAQLGYAERLDTDPELRRLRQAFERHGLDAQVVRGWREFMRRADRGQLFKPNGFRLVFDKTEGGGHVQGFGPARRALGPLLCATYGAAYCHGDAYSAAITRHKYHQTLVLQDAGVPTPTTWSYTVDRGWYPHAPPMGTPVICKSTYEGWSIGVTEDTTGPFTDRTLDAVQDLAQTIGQPVCVQRYIPGAEIYVLVMEHQGVAVTGLAEAFSSTGPKPNGDYLVFEDHCRPGGIVYRPPKLEAELARRLSHGAVAAFRALGMRGYGRIDFRVGPDGDFAAFDIADNPGTSPAGSATHILRWAGVALEDIPMLLVGLGLAWNAQAMGAQPGDSSGYMATLVGGPLHRAEHRKPVRHASRHRPRLQEQERAQGKPR